MEAQGTREAVSVIMELRRTTTERRRADPPRDSRIRGQTPLPIGGRRGCAGEDRTFRLDRIADARTLPGSFEPPTGLEPAERLLTSMARAPYQHEVTLRIQGTLKQIRKRLPASVAEVRDGADEGWQCVEIRAESLDWLPAVLAALDLPFVIERPDELRDRVVALADRLATSGRKLS